MQQGDKVMVWLDDATSEQPATIHTIEEIPNSAFLVACGHPAVNTRIHVRMDRSGRVYYAPTGKIRAR